MKYKSLIFLTVVINLFSVVNCIAQKNTLENLQIAIRDEANRAYQYDLYADQAAKNGYEDLSRLFCAISKGENVLMRDHERELKKLGKNVESFKISKASIGSSSNNLMEAIKKEANDNKIIYKKFANDAKKENVNGLMDKFNTAVKTETNHEYLLKKALYNLDKNIPQDYYVSNKTGEVNWSCQCVAECKCQAPPKGQPGERFSKF